LGHGTKNPGQVELDLAWENDPASYHRIQSKVLSRFSFPPLIHSLTQSGSIRTISRIFQTAASLTASDPSSPDPMTAAD
jgi:hypothetical protein